MRTRGAMHACSGRALRTGDRLALALAEVILPAGDIRILANHCSLISDARGRCRRRGAAASSCSALGTHRAGSKSPCSDVGGEGATRGEVIQGEGVARHGVSVVGHDVALDRVALVDAAGAGCKKVKQWRGQNNTSPDLQALPGCARYTWLSFRCAKHKCAWISAPVELVPSLFLSLSAQPEQAVECPRQQSGVRLGESRGRLRGDRVLHDLLGQRAHEAGGGATCTPQICSRSTTEYRVLKAYR